MYLIILEFFQPSLRPPNELHFFTWLFNDSEIALELGPEMGP